MDKRGTLTVGRQATVMIAGARYKLFTPEGNHHEGAPGGIRYVKNPSGFLGRSDLHHLEWINGPGILYFASGNHKNKKCGMYPWQKDLQVLSEFLGNEQVD